MRALTHIARTLIALTAVILSLAVHAAVAQAAPTNDVWTAAAPVPLAGIAVSEDVRTATADAQEPAPSCAGGAAKAEDAVWFRVDGPKSAPRIATFAVRGHTAGALLAVFAVKPDAGTELACVRAAVGNPATLAHVLEQGRRYYVLVGSAPDGPRGDVIDVQVSLRRTNWVADTPLAARRQGVAAAGSETALWAFGGLQTSFLPGADTGFHSQAVNRLDVRTGRWQLAGQLPFGLSYGQAVPLGGRIYLPGGQTNPVNGAGCTATTTLVFDPVKRTFTQGTAVSGPATWDYAAAADPRRGLVYVAGGVWDPTPCDFGAEVNDQQQTPRIRAYQVKTAKWFELTPMTEARQGATAQVADGRLYVFGGLRGGMALATVECYDPVTGFVSHPPKMPVPVYGAVSGVGQAADGRPLIYVAGGWTHLGGGADDGTTQLFDVRANKWFVLESRLTPRDALAGAVAAGWLYAVAGHGPQPIRAVERLKVDARPPTARVVRTGDLLVVRASDPSGIASVQWRSGSRLVGRGARLRLKMPITRLRAVVRDGAGNARVVRA